MQTTKQKHIVKFICIHGVWLFTFGPSGIEPGYHPAATNTRLDFLGI
jgi:hypothetical protein